MITKRIAYFIFGCMLFWICQAQPYSNSWIVHSQPYYKIKIGKDGIYKVDSLTLTQAGINLSIVNPQWFQLWQKGQPIYPYIAGEADGVFNVNDYMIFYAEKNNGEDDSSLFVSGVTPFITNPFYSVISDTSAVFLTWSGNPGNPRLILNTDTTFTSLNPSPYYNKELYSANQGGYNLGPNVPLEGLSIYDPRYFTGEGWTKNMIVENQAPDTFLLNTSAVYQNTPRAYITVCISGANTLNLTIDHKIQIDYLDLSGNWIFLDSMSFRAFSSYRRTYTINPATFGSSSRVRVSSLTNPYTTMDNFVDVNYVRVLLPYQFNMLNTTFQKIHLPDDSQGRSKVVLINYPAVNPVIIDVTDHLLLSVRPLGSDFQAIVPNNGGDKLCIAVSQSNIMQVAKITPVNSTWGTPGSFVDYSNLLADSIYLMISNPVLMTGPGNPVIDYQNFRSMDPNGGHFNVLLASILDLYDQFAYGVEISPLAIRNFCAYIISQSTMHNPPFKRPSNLLLIGKSIHPVDCIAGTYQGSPARYTSECLLPTFGNPSSDALLTQGLPGSVNYEAAIPTGRISAQTQADVQAYFSKLQLYVVQNEDSLWKKRAIHFIGGNSASEQSQLEGYMDAYKSIYEDTLEGGEVFTFKKISTQPISVTSNDSVAELINSGVALLTFFGHGSHTGFDQNIDDPQNYNNSPRFPFILANSCSTGDIHDGDELSHVEVWSLAKNDHGCIGYIATVTEGVVDKLQYYSMGFYQNLSYRYYGQSYGTIMQNGVRNLLSDPLHLFDTLMIEACMEMTLQGDPALQPYSYSKPDYAINQNDVIFNIGPTEHPDSIGVKIIMTNLGKAIRDSFSVYFLRVFPNGDSTLISRFVKGPMYQDTLSFNIYKDYTRAVGLNTFTVKLDFPNLIPELNEYNNNTSVGLFIKGSDLEPVWPYLHAIVSNIASVTLKASTADPFAPLTTYRFQVDTNDAFLNPFINQTISAPGGVVNLPIILHNVDSTVYFWRVAKDTSTAPNWKESSFQVITGKYGWGEAHFNQFKNDVYQYVKYDLPFRRFDFVNNVNSIQVNTGNFPTNYWTLTQFFYENGQERIWTCGADGWMIATFDSITGNLQYSDTLGGTGIDNNGSKFWRGIYGNCICGGSYPLAGMTHDFGRDNACRDTVDWRPKLVSFLNSIPNGTPVLAYTVKCDAPGYCNNRDPVTPGMINGFQSIGSNLIGNLTDTTLMVIFGKKGMVPGQAHEVISSTKAQLLRFSDSLNTRFKNGFIATELIGPAINSDTAWKSLHWRFFSLEPNSHDYIRIQVSGIRANGQKDSLVTFYTDSMDVLDLGHYVKGTQYPYIQLIAWESDTLNHTPPQLRRWQVIFDQAPEAALDPSLGYALPKNPVSEGDNIIVYMPFQNISDFPFRDSLLMTYYLEDVNFNIHPLPNKMKKRPFLPGAIWTDTIMVNTSGYGGSNLLGIDMNPPGKLKYQWEQFHFNNIAQIGFSVNKDKINPLLDVTFDGIHILNQDIVSSKPSVLVSLKDENKFLALNDTSDFTVKLLPPGGSSETPLYFKDVLQFTPAQMPNNSCKINYHPELLEDGIYTLHVTAKDRSGNQSGQFDYRIQFQIINKPMVTEVLNYPNPFSTSTRFVFTITGSDIPETFKIQILTISGRLVKEINRSDLGYLHIGRNITDYAWDGRDEYGDKLGNGVYLYHVETRLHGNEMDHLSTTADSYFKKGYGKMVLMH